MNKKDFLKDLLHKYGINYVLYAKDNLSYPWLEAIVNKAKGVFKYDFIDKEGKKFLYFLYDIKDMAS